jgi:hypothetical protein
MHAGFSCMILVLRPKVVRKCIGYYDLVCTKYERVIALSDVWIELSQQYPYGRDGPWSWSWSQSPFLSSMARKKGRHSCCMIYYVVLRYSHGTLHTCDDRPCIRTR